VKRAEALLGEYGQTSGMPITTGASQILYSFGSERPIQGQGRLRNSAAITRDLWEESRGCLV
jgi:hypothetical protein